MSLFILETVSCYLLQAGLELTKPRLALNSLRSSCLNLSRDGIPNMCHHTQLELISSPLAEHHISLLVRADCAMGLCSGRSSPESKDWGARDAQNTECKTQIPRSGARGNCRGLESSKQPNIIRCCGLHCSTRQREHTRVP